MNPKVGIRSRARIARMIRPEKMSAMGRSRKSLYPVAGRRAHTFSYRLCGGLTKVARSPVHVRTAEAKSGRMTTKTRGSRLCKSKPDLFGTFINLPFAISRGKGSWWRCVCLWQRGPEGELGTGYNLQGESGGLRD